MATGSEPRSVRIRKQDWPLAPSPWHLSTPSDLQGQAVAIGQVCTMSRSEHNGSLARAQQSEHSREPRRGLVTQGT